MTSSRFDEPRWIASFWVVLCLIAALCSMRELRAQDSLQATRPDWANIKLLFAFQGKGSCLPFDAGVLHEAYARIPALKSQQVVVTGNSSGSIPAAYFGCYGFSDETVHFAEQKLLTGNRDAIRTMENANSKLAKLLRGRSTEISHEELREYIAFALGVGEWKSLNIEQIIKRSHVQPRFPMLIMACNKEVLEDRETDTRAVQARRYKQIRLDNLTVEWLPEVHAYYQQHPDQFDRDHPNLKLDADWQIGHAVTFFVDQSLFDLLSKIPPEERTADLRLMTTAADVALAIIASASEPTYFDPVPDPEPAKILVRERLGDLGNVRRRTYYGGYLVSLPAQDVRRMLPGSRVLGTGLAHHPLSVRRLLTDWLLADCEVIAQQNEWWADMQTTPNDEFYSHMTFRDLTAQQEYDAGQQHARECFDRDSGLPPLVSVPKFLSPAAAAVQPAFDAPEMLDRERGNRLRTLRGLGPLLLR
jgi:predicted acylesterase/phospholipase RssA